jgi:hypothetical protein
MTLPTNEWSAGDVINPNGYFADHAMGAPVNADAMIKALVAKFEPFVPANTAFSRYTIFTMASPTAPQLPRVSGVLTNVGDVVADNLYQAVQLTFHFKTADFNDSKIVLLDAVPQDDFNKILNPLDFANVPALADEWTSDINAWRGRDGTRPTTISTITCDLNDRLRRAYRDA